VSEILIVYLESSKDCKACGKAIAAGEKAIRKAHKETKRASVYIEYFHEVCWVIGGKRK
jgi:hypothetical protein